MMRSDSGHSGSDDGIIVSSFRPAFAGGRPGMAVMFGRDGPLSVVFVLGQRAGRWHLQTTKAAMECKNLLSLLRACDVVERGQPATDYVAGLVVMRSWHFVTQRASHEHTYALIQAELAASSRRSGQRFIEHEVIAAAVVHSSAAGGEGIGQVLPMGAWENRTAHVVASGLLADCEDRGVRYRVTKGAGV